MSACAAADKTIEDYQAFMEQHVKDRARFVESLNRMADLYEAEGRDEDAIRYMIELIGRVDKNRLLPAMQKRFDQYRLEKPEAMEKVYREIHGDDSPQRKTPQLVSDQTLVDGILQRDDRKLREACLKKVREMLVPETDDEIKRSALVTLGKSFTAKFDRQPFRPLILPLLKSEDEVVRTLAASSLAGLNPVKEDLKRVVGLVEDASPMVREQMGNVIIHLGRGEQAELAIPALSTLLRDSDTKVVVKTLRAMWGQYASPEFDALLIELSNDPRYHGYTMYHALSTMKTKSVAVCRRLVQELDHPDWNNSGRAAWGLTYGVSPDAAAVVEEGLLKAIPEETNDYTRTQAFKALARVASEKSRAYLEAVVASETETEKFRDMARDVLAGLK
ncbi:MAG: HEAT repeat domain-containing protein [Verrucomicrobiota bacterium]